MALDTTSLNQLITDFRALSQKDSISPESLGSLLQRIADLLKTCSTDTEAKPLFALLKGIKAVHSALVSIAQGNDDRNNVLMTFVTSNLLNGTSVKTENATFIRQATTERAGAMRAQHVAALNAATSGVQSLRTSVDSLSGTVSSLTGSVSNLSKEVGTMADTIDGLYDSVSEISNKSATLEKSVNASQSAVNDMNGKVKKLSLPKIECRVVGDKVSVLNFREYVSAGYVPYLFRCTVRRNRLRMEKFKLDGYAERTKGWNMFGGQNVVKVSNSGVLSFSNKDHTQWYNDNLLANGGYESNPLLLVDPHVQTQGSYDGYIVVSWGKRNVKVRDQNDAGDKGRLLRFRFAIGFGRKISQKSETITPAGLASNLGFFSVVYDPFLNAWHFSRT